MLKDFTAWLDDIAEVANKRKHQIELKTGKRPKWNNRVKNKEIKERFSLEGLKTKGIRPRSSSDRKAREWLYDLVWREYSESGYFMAVKLAMEIELSDMKLKGLIYDYNKLLQSDAEYKIFVFQQKTVIDSKSIFEELATRTKEYSSRVSAEVLLCCWCWETATFHYKEIRTVPLL